MVDALKAVEKKMETIKSSKFKIPRCQSIDTNPSFLFVFIFNRVCLQGVYDRYQCDFASLLAEIKKEGSKEAVKLLLDDLTKVAANCVNVRCKPECVGDDECPSYLKSDNDDCVKDAWNDVRKDIKDPSIREALEVGRDASLKQIKELKKCNGIKCPK